MPKHTPIKNIPMHLAPMEGVLDASLRSVICAVGGYGKAHSEFVRVSNHLHSDSTFLKVCPEINTACKTDDGTPVALQLLGSDPNAMAENAHKAYTLGVTHIDVNFGCPARMVNKSGGGAEMLKTPDCVYKVISAINAIRPNGAILSGKMRLGYNDKTLATENACAIETAGGSIITVHGRTKKQGYTGYADWETVAQIKQATDCDIFVNGDIIDADSCQRALRISNADGVVIGRGALMTPNLGTVLQQDEPPMEWNEVLYALQKYCRIFPPCAETPSHADKYRANRIKQWLGVYLIHTYPQAKPLFDTLKTLQGQNFITALNSCNTG